MTSVEDFETGIFLEGDQWLANWKPEMTYQEWEDAREEAGAILCPTQQTTTTLSLAERLTMKAKNR